LQKHFSEHFRPTKDESKTIWAEAVFVFDANVLLNLYRLSTEHSSAIVGMLKTVKDRLFLPHQVAAEFFRHREEEIASQVNEFERVRNYLKSIPSRFKSEFPRYPCIPIGEIAQVLTDCVTSQMAKVDECQEANQLNFVERDDPILAQLADLFAECTQEPYTPKDDDALNKKVEDRIKGNLPPCRVESGPKAAPPTESNPHRGDGRVWFQIVSYLEKTKKPLIFVTADQGLNWWRTAKLGNKERPVGPHFQLIRDAELASGKRFLMYSEEQFLSEAPAYLGVPAQQVVIEEIVRIHENAFVDKDIGDLDQPKTVRKPGPEDEEKESGTHDPERMEKDRAGADDQEKSQVGELRAEQKAESEEKELG
jgi:hypothetical protein